MPAEEQPQVIGKCRIVSKLGEGGMGVVYKGRHVDLDLDVAVKVLASHLAGREDMATRFVREARLAARIDHSGVVRVLDCGQQDDLYYMVMEFVDGQSFQDLIDAKGAIPIPAALEVIRAVADALGSAQKQVGIIHRDIKPDNVMLTSDGKIKVADLGLAKIVADQQQKSIEGATAAGVAMGTPHYMSPEQCMDARSVDHRADIYSLGATLYYAISGTMPFGGETLFALMRNVVEAEPHPLPETIPVPVRTLIHKMMAKKPEDRYQTYDEVIKAIDYAKVVAEKGETGAADGQALTLVEGGDQPSAYGLASAPATPAVQPGPPGGETMPFYDVEGGPGGGAAGMPGNTAATQHLPGSTQPSAQAAPSKGAVAAAAAARPSAEPKKKGGGGFAAVAVLLLLAAAAGGAYWAYTQGYLPIGTAATPEGPDDGGTPVTPVTPPEDTELRFGRIAATEGAVELSRDEGASWQPLTEGTSLVSGDRLRTKDSRARVAFESGSGIFVDRFTEMECAREEDKPLGVSLTSGGLYAETVSADKGFWVETPKGRVVDFGTRFTIEIKDDGVHIVVAEGKVEVSTDAGRMEVLAGNEVVLRGRDATPGEVKAVVNVDDRLAWAAGLRQIEKEIAAKRDAAFRKALAAAGAAERADDIESAARALEKALEQREDAKVAERLAVLREEIERRRAEAEKLMSEQAVRAKETKVLEGLAERARGMAERGEFEGAVAAIEAVKATISSEEVLTRIDALLGEVRSAEVAAGKQDEEARLERERASYAALVGRVREMKAAGKFAEGYAAIEAFRDTIESDVIKARIDDLLAELKDAEAVSQKTAAEKEQAEEERLARQAEAFEGLAVQARDMKDKGEYVLAAAAVDAFRQTVESKDLLAKIDALLAEIKGAEEAMAARQAKELENFEKIAVRVRGMKKRGDFVAAYATIDAFRPTVESRDIRRKLDELEAELKAAEADARAAAAAAAVSATGGPVKTTGGTTTGDTTTPTKTVTPGAGAAWEKKGFVALTEHKGWVRSVAFTPDGEYLLTGSADKTANMWEVATGKLVRTFGMHGDAINSVAVSPNGRYLATGGSDKVAALWDLTSARRLRNFIGHSDKVYAVAFSPSGHRLVTGSKDESAMIWEVEAGKQAAPPCRPKKHFVNSVAYAPNERYIVTGLAQKEGRRMVGGAVLWDAQTGEGQKQFREKDGFVTSVVFSPDSRFVATGDNNLRLAVLWDVHSGRKVRSFSGHRGGVWAVAFSPDGRHLATASDDKTAALYEVDSGKRTQTFKGHKKGVIAVATSPDGRYVATGSQDNTARIWRVGK
jgi:ferric-dicitrate binding protein FerR (iron transport regulator)/tricorn protease-like protein